MMFRATCNVHAVMDQEEPPDNPKNLAIRAVVREEFRLNTFRAVRILISDGASMDVGPDILISILYQKTLANVHSGRLKIAVGRPNFAVSVYDARTFKIMARKEEMKEPTVEEVL